MVISFLVALEVVARLDLAPRLVERVGDLLHVDLAHDVERVLAGHGPSLLTAAGHGGDALWAATNVKSLSARPLFTRHLGEAHGHRVLELVVDHRLADLPCSRIDGQDQPGQGGQRLLGREVEHLVAVARRAAAPGSGSARRSAPQACPSPARKLPGGTGQRLGRRAHVHLVQRGRVDPERLAVGHDLLGRRLRVLPAQLAALLEIDGARGGIVWLRLLLNAVWVKSAWRSDIRPYAASSRWTTSSSEAPPPARSTKAGQGRREAAPTRARPPRARRAEGRARARRMPSLYQHRRGGPRGARPRVSAGGRGGRFAHRPRPRDAGARALTRTRTGITPRSTAARRCAAAYDRSMMRSARRWPTIGDRDLDRSSGVDGRHLHATPERQGAMSGRQPVDVEDCAAGRLRAVVPLPVPRGRADLFPRSRASLIAASLRACGPGAVPCRLRGRRRPQRIQGSARAPRPARTR